jgi:hypothetical protein
VAEGTEITSERSLRKVKIERWKKKRDSDGEVAAERNPRSDFPLLFASPSLREEALFLDG